MNLLGRFTAGLLACCLLAAGCGSDEPAEEDSRAESDSAFPVTIQHKYGQTEIPEEPQRVLSLGFQEHAFVSPSESLRSRCATGTATRTT